MLTAIKRMDNVRCKLLLVLEGGRFAGLLSIGDIQRAIIQNRPMSTPIREIVRKDIIVCHAGDSQNHIRDEMTRCRAVFMPILDEAGQLADVVFWEDCFPSSFRRPSVDLGLPVVIMAGGAGTRLRPLTHVLPKAMLPIGSQTIIETIIERFARVGCRKVFLSLNYKADLLRYYLMQGDSKGYDITFFQESQPLGTAGSLSLIKDRLRSTFFVTNCDILIEQELDEIIDYHRENKNDLTVVAALKHLRLPYGTLQTGQNGVLKALDEKPDIVFKINSGIYVLEPHVLQLIPMNAYCNMTQVIESTLANSGRVGVFPVSEGSWTDIGNWDDYMRILKAHGADVA
jgi:dTDP-glucose pyrophosphorylase